MPNVRRLFENLYDVNGYLILLEPGTLDPATEDGRVNLVHFTEYIKDDEFLHWYGADTVIHLVPLPQKGMSNPVPIHVEQLPEPMRSALKRYRHDST